MIEREGRANEVRTVTSGDGRTVFAIVRRRDGLFGFNEDRFAYDEDLEGEYWQVDHGPPNGLFGTPDDAEREIRARNAHLF